jgi:hypothetical protein
LSNRVEKYDVLNELAQAPAGLTFGQLVRGDAEHAQKTLKKLLAARSSSKVSTIDTDSVPRKLRLVAAEVESKEVLALLDSGAVPDIMSSRLARLLQLQPKSTSRNITVANGATTAGAGVLQGVNVKFGDIQVHLDFLVIENPPFDIIVGMPTMEALRTCIDTGKQLIYMTHDGKSAKLCMILDVGRSESTQMEEADSEDFTSPECSDTEESGSGTDADEKEGELVVTVYTDEDACGGGENEASESELLEAKLGHLAAEQRQEIENAMQEENVIATSIHDLRPAEVHYEHSFELTTDVPMYQRNRRLNPKHNDIIREELDKMLAARIIKPAISAYSSPVVIVAKKDGKPRFCVDYRALNAIMKPDRWPLPNIEEILDDLQGCRYFSTIDLFSGYWQVKVSESCKEKTTFVCKYGTFSFEVMPFGLMNAPATFQRMMDRILSQLPFVQVYIDDVVIFSKTLKEHVEHIFQTIKTIGAHGLKLKLSKCFFAHPEIKVLGHVVNEQGVSTDPDKVAIIQKCPRPMNATAVRAFLGLASYYRRFVPGFAGLAKPLHELTSPKSFFSWTEAHESAFANLKQKLSMPPVLTYPDFAKEFVVETDASSWAVGAILSQRDENGRLHPCQFASRTLSPAEKNYSTHYGVIS